MPLREGMFMPMEMHPSLLKAQHTPTPPRPPQQRCSQPYQGELLESRLPHCGATCLHVHLQQQQQRQWERTCKS